MVNEGNVLLAIMQRTIIQDFWRKLFRSYLYAIGIFFAYCSSFQLHLLELACILCFWNLFVRGLYQFLDHRCNPIAILMAGIHFRGEVNPKYGL